jgi:GPI mannosyltransferase 2
MVAILVPKRGVDGASSRTRTGILTLGRLTEEIFPSHGPPVTWRKLLSISMSCRLVIVFSMAISCWLFPNHNPGDDVLRFPLRLEEKESTSSSCFCLRGQACHEERWNDITTRTRTSTSDLRMECVDATDTRKDHGVQPPLLLNAFYKFFLTPTTRWDAARFLDLAVYPSRRDLPRPCTATSTSTSTSSTTDDTASICQQLLVSAEQSHAFFPLFPLVIRTVANTILMLPWIPSWLLPPTYEGVVALAAWLVNLGCFLGASLALYDMTLSLLQHQYHEIILPDRAERKRQQQQQEPRRRLCQLIALQVFLLFCINPATIFFTAAYSESMFAFTNFTGHALLLRAATILRQQQQQQRQQTSMTKKRLSSSSSSFIIILGMTGIMVWMMASYTRSNGSINAGYLLLFGIAILCHGMSMGQQQKRYNNNNSKTILYGFIACLVAAILVILPIAWHDTMGYQRLCQQQQPSTAAAAGVAQQVILPSWCTSSSGADTAAAATTATTRAARRFSLYGHVQRKYWNVGWFKYYTVKKIPNFILAAPILLLAMTAVVEWIHTSYHRHHQYVRVRASGQVLPKRGNNGIVSSIISWAISALRTWVDYQLFDDGQQQQQQKQQQPVSSSSSSSSVITTIRDQDVKRELLMGPLMLGHYAVLAAACLLGLTVAHVEISTRMICSTCPAIYWYMTLCCCQNHHHIPRMALAVLLGKFVIPYCLLYIVLGVVMHPNWLPWT